jgi:hypothetical protein
MKASILLLFILTGYRNPVLTLFIAVAPHYHCRSNPTIDFTCLTVTSIYLPQRKRTSTFIIITVAIAREHRIELLTEDNFNT